MVRVPYTILIACVCWEFSIVIFKLKCLRYVFSSIIPRFNQPFVVVVEPNHPFDQLPNSLPPSGASAPQALPKGGLSPSSSGRSPRGALNTTAKTRGGGGGEGGGGGYRSLPQSLALKSASLDSCLATSLEFEVKGDAI